MTLEIWVLAGALVAIASVALTTVLTGSPPTPTSPAVRRAVLELLPARLPGGEAAPIIELGAGWGGLSLALAKRYPDRAVIGLEISPLPWLVSRLRLVFQPRPNLRLRFGDFRKCELSGNGLVVCYLSANLLAELRGKLEAELPAGALVVSSTFAIPDWQPVDRVTARDLYKSPVYLYEVGGPER